MSVRLLSNPPRAELHKIGGLAAVCTRFGGRPPSGDAETAAFHRVLSATTTIPTMSSSATKKTAFNVLKFLQASIADGSVKSDDVEGLEVAGAPATREWRGARELTGPSRCSAVYLGGVWR